MGSVYFPREYYGAHAMQRYRINFQPNAKQFTIS